MSDTTVEKSVEYFQSGYYCAESVLMAIAESRGIQSDLIPRIATGFCSGIARTSGLCGAVSGGIMAIGLVLGRAHPKDSVDRSYRAVRALMDKVTDCFGSVNCYDLIECKLDSEAGQEKFCKEEKIKVCVSLVEKVTQITLNVLNEEETHGPPDMHNGFFRK